MRGKARLFRPLCTRSRITPAYAGKRSVKDLDAGGLWDHPRVCGEKSTEPFKGGGALGSPPRMRGKAPSGVRPLLDTRITPAYAGKSLTIQKMTTRSRDHPRVCGEKSETPSSRRTGWGSPPRMRGKGQSLPRDHPQSGITPAYAGKSVAITCRAWNPRDHPRVCGEKLPLPGPGWWPWGSPPRMRGKD